MKAELSADTLIYYFRLILNAGGLATILTACSALCIQITHLDRKRTLTWPDEDGWTIARRAKSAAQLILAYLVAAGLAYLAAYCFGIIWSSSLGRENWAVLPLAFGTPVLLVLMHTSVVFRTGREGRKLLSSTRLAMPDRDACLATRPPKVNFNHLWFSTGRDRRAIIMWLSQTCPLLAHIAVWAAVPWVSLGVYVLAAIFDPARVVVSDRLLFLVSYATLSVCFIAVMVLVWLLNLSMPRTALTRNLLINGKNPPRLSYRRVAQGRNSALLLERASRKHRKTIPNTYQTRYLEVTNTLAEAIRVVRVQAMSRQRLDVVYGELSHLAVRLCVAPNFQASLDAAERAIKGHGLDLLNPKPPLRSTLQSRNEALTALANMVKIGFLGLAIPLFVIYWIANGAALSDAVEWLPTP